MNKLIKLSDTHYIVVDDSEIKEGVNQYYYDRYIKGIRNSSGAQYGETQLVITHSTQPLESIPYPPPSRGFKIDYNKIKPLSLSEVEELVSGYSAYNHKAEEQIRRIKESGEYLTDLMMKSIMPKTEWDVEFIDGKLKLI